MATKQLTNPQKVTIWVAIISAVGAAVVALVSHSSGTGEEKKSEHAVNPTPQVPPISVVVNADHSKSQGRVEITDISVSYPPDDNGKYDPVAIIDFRVTNKGELPVAINRLQFKVISVTAMNVKGELRISTEYSLNLMSLRRPGQTVDTIVALQLAPGETDRFVVRASHGLAFWDGVLEPTLITSNGEVRGKRIEISM